MRFSLVAFVTAYFCVFAPRASGDGCFVRTKDDVNVYVPDQKAIISWANGRETMILSTKLQSDKLDDFGWIIPVKTRHKPKVELAETEAFFVMSHFFDPPQYGKSLAFGCAAAPAVMYGSIEIVETRALDIYDVTVLKASDARRLYEWLSTNGFMLAQGAEDILQDYTNEDFYFVTAKLDLRNEHSGHIDILRKYDLYDVAERLVAHEAKLPGRYEYGHWSHDARDVLKSALQQAPYQAKWRNSMGSDAYYRLRNRLADAADEQNMLAEAINNVTDIMAELHAGLARPLRIDFETEQAFFPLRISSINPGDVRVVVYLLSSDRMFDESGSLALAKEKKVDEQLRRKLKDALDLERRGYACKFTFSGNSQQFTNDVHFGQRRLNMAEKAFEPLFLGW